MASLAKIIGMVLPWVAIAIYVPVMVITLRCRKNRQEKSSLWKVLSWVPALLLVLAALGCRYSGDSVGATVWGFLAAFNVMTNLTERYVSF